MPQQPQQTAEERARWQDPRVRFEATKKRIEELDDNDPSTKRVKKRLYQKLAKLRKELKVDVEDAGKLKREKGWTEEKKAEMRASQKWTRVAGKGEFVEV